MSFVCPICHQTHDGLPHIGADYPAYYWDVAEEERERRITMTSDICEIDSQYFFIRGVIEIPVHDHPKGFGFGVWVSQKEENYRTYLENFDSVKIGPFFGWLCNSLSFYPTETLLLKTRARFRGNGLRPTIELHQEEEHPLALDQRNGISLERAWEIVHFYTTNE